MFYHEEARVFVDQYTIQQLKIQALICVPFKTQNENA